MADSVSRSAIQVRALREAQLRGVKNFLRHHLNGLKVGEIDFTFLIVCVSVVKVAK